MDVRIVELNDTLIPQAKALVSRVFPEQSFDERISFWVYTRRRSKIMKFFLNIYGSMGIYQYWVALDENDKICGITGIYSVNRDVHDSIWLSWFCVDPEMRKKGIGRLLIEFSINIAKSLGKKYLRLYTSDDPNEKAAQGLYDKYDFKIVSEKKQGNCTIFYREKVL